MRARTCPYGHGRVDHGPTAVRLRRAASICWLLVRGLARASGAQDLVGADCDLRRGSSRRAGRKLWHHDRSAATLFSPCALGRLLLLPRGEKAARGLNCCGGGTWPAGACEWCCSGATQDRARAGVAHGRARRPAVPARPRSGGAAALRFRPRGGPSSAAFAGRDARVRPGVLGGLLGGARTRARCPAAARRVRSRPGPRSARPRASRAP